ncbi:MAG: DUF3854 domain-containing protein [Candidatus Riflebacteria bacterium]|nr:DUF3854 domain-containing protein [Candidatus Riflebacteria bacterium]
MSYTKFLAGRDPQDPLSLSAIADIENSGLTPATLDDAGVTVFNGTAEELAAIIGIEVDRASHMIAGRAFIRFPYGGWDDGTATFERVKLIPGLSIEDGKVIKYLQPTGVSTRPYIVKQCRTAATSPTTPIIFTEGEKKTLKLMQHGQYAIGFAGVWNFRDKNADDVSITKALHQELMKFIWSARTVYLAFDADFATNPNVRKALIELSIHLYAANADVKFLTWPADRGKGIDDYLVGRPDPDMAIADLIQHATPLKSFLGKDHLKDVIDGIAKSASNTTCMELITKEIAPWLGVKPKTLLDDCKKRCRELVKYSKVTAKPTDIIEVKYAFEDGRLTRITAQGKTNIGDFEAHIEEVGHDETGDEHYRIVGKSVHGGDFSIRISAKDFADARKLKAAMEQGMGARDSISASEVNHIGPAIKRLSANTEIQHIRLFRRTGWVNTPDGYRFLIPGNDIPGHQLELTEGKMAYALSDTADLRKGLEALKSLLVAQDPEVTTLALTFVLQAPFGRLAGWEDERYCLFIKGKTGSLKTSFTQVLMSIWGPRFLSEDTLIKWGEGTTGNALTYHAAMATDMPLYVDNYKPTTGFGAKAFITAIHNILEGGEKDRMIDGSELRKSRKISAWPICTGEDIPDDDSASLARSVILHLKWESGKTNPELERAQQLGRHLSAIGRYWLMVLEQWRKDSNLTEGLKTLFTAKRTEWMRLLHQRFPTMVTSARIASNLASNELTWMILNQVPEFAPILKDFAAAHANGLMRAATELAHATTESNEAEVFLSTVRDLILSNRLKLRYPSSPVAEDIRNGLLNEPREISNLEGPETVHGWWERDGSLNAILGPVLDEVGKIRKTPLAISSRTLLSQLKERGAIASNDSDGNLKSRHVQGKTYKVLHLKASAVGGPTAGSAAGVPGNE